MLSTRFTYPSVSFCSSASARRSSSSETSPSRLSSCTSRISSRRTLRTETLPSSAMLRAMRLSSRRRSSLSSGMGRRRVVPALAGALRDGEAQDLAVVLRVEAYVGVPDRPLYVLERVRVERRDREQPGLRHADVGDAPEVHLRPVGLDLDPVQQGGVGPPGPDGREVAPHGLHGALHPTLRGRAIDDVSPLAPPPPRTPRAP